MELVLVSESISGGFDLRIGYTEGGIGGVGTERRGVKKLKVEEDFVIALEGVNRQVEVGGTVDERRRRVGIRQVAVGIQVLHD